MELLLVRLAIAQRNKVRNEQVSRLERDVHLLKKRMKDFDCEDGDLPEPDMQQLIIDSLHRSCDRIEREIYQILEEAEGEEDESSPSDTPSL
jgi:hypothetical protein